METKLMFEEIVFFTDPDSNQTEMLFVTPDDDGFWTWVADRDIVVTDHYDYNNMYENHLDLLFEKMDQSLHLNGQVMFNFL